jgi:RNA polymerase sigma-70 factor (ECF subfamily)
LAKSEPVDPNDTLSHVEAAASAYRTDLVSRARGGDGHAFAALVEPLIDAALGSAVLIAGRADAEDAVQDALVNAWLGLTRLREPEAFPAWFRRQVVRSALRAARKRRATDTLDDQWPDAADAIERGVAQRQLARAFQRISVGDRVVLTLHYFWGLATAESAEILQVPAGTVKSRVHAALQRLRAEFDAEERRDGRV